MSWALVWTRAAIKDLKRIAPKERERIRGAVRRFAETGHGDTRKLTDTGDEYRLRAGKWRVKFTYHKDAHELWVLEVFDRKDASY